MRTGAIRRRFRPLHQLWSAVRFVWRGSRRWTIASLAIVLVQGALPLASLYLLKLLVDIVVAEAAAPNNAPETSGLAVVIALLGAVAVVGAVARSVGGVVGDAQAQAVADYMHDIIHAQSLAVDLAYYENPLYHDTLHRAQLEAPHRPTRIVTGLLHVGQNGISLVAVAALLFAFDWRIALMLLTAVVPGLAVRVRFSHRVYEWQYWRTRTERLALYFNALLVGSSHAKEVRLFDLGPLFMDRFRQLRRQLMRERLRISARRSTAELGAQLCAVAAILGAYVFLIKQVLHGGISIGALVMYLHAFQRGQDFLAALLSGIAAIYEDRLFLSGFDEFLALKPSIAEPRVGRPVPRPLRSGLCLEAVAFQYPNSPEPVLRCITLSALPGETIALVGENGAGKSTLVKLLCRLYEPSSGSITLDGIDLRDFRLAELRREMSVIFQDYAKYHLDVAENIWVGDVHHPRDGRRIAAAAHLAGADGMIDRLPEGYATMLGNWFDRGKELSLGEWQKVALARAFLRDAQIVVLDEPSSALDARTEYEVFSRFQSLIRGRTAILVSHRLSTVKMANRIYVMNDGTIAESGTHDELMRQGRIYAQLFDIQAQSYR